jgi:hypothetical protein
MRRSFSSPYTGRRPSTAGAAAGRSRSPAGVDGPAGNEAIGKPLDRADDVVEGQADGVR